MGNAEQRMLAAETNRTGAGAVLNLRMNGPGRRLGHRFPRRGFFKKHTRHPHSLFTPSKFKRNIRSEQSELKCV